MERNSKKPYLTPEVEVTVFASEDIIVTSVVKDNDTEDIWGEGGWL